MLDKKQTETIVQGWKQRLNKEIDTLDLQVLSLEAFLEPLGYEIQQNHTNGVWHVKKVSTGLLEAPMFISFDLAVKLYNNEPYLGSRFLNMFTREQLNQAEKAKIVENIFLQRKEGEFIAQKNMIKFVDSGISSKSFTCPMESY